MKVGLYKEGLPVSVTELAIPDCGENDVLVEAMYSLLPGGLNDSAESWGVVGRVSDFGMNVFDFNLGERVYPCPGSAASPLGEFLLIENASYNRTLYPLPDSVPDRAAALIAPFTAGCRIARCGMKLRGAEEVYYIAVNGQSYQGDIRYQDGERAIVFGAGLTGLSAALFLLWFGMEKVTVCDASRDRLAHAAAFGLSTLLTGDALPSDFVSCIGEADCWIDTTGDASILSSFMAYGKPGARLVTAAGEACPAAFDLKVLSADEKTIIGAGSPSTEDVQDTVSLISSGIWDLETLFENECSIEEASASESDAFVSDASLTLIRW